MYDGDVDGFAAMLPRYRSELSGARSLDYDEQIVRAIEILLTDPTARAVAQRACRVLLVDEFQDLTPAHLLLVRLLAGPDGSVFGVGDDDQTIYGFNGADPQWLIDFADVLPSRRRPSVGGQLPVPRRCRGSRRHPVAAQRLAESPSHPRHRRRTKALSIDRSARGLGGDSRRHRRRHRRRDRDKRHRGADTSQLVACPGSGRARHGGIALTAASVQNSPIGPR